MRSLLQFLGFASSTVCATLLAGILLTTSANAGATDPPISASCVNCCACDAVNDCYFTGIGTGCGSFNCLNCNTCAWNGFTYICRR